MLSCYLKTLISLSIVKKGSWCHHKNVGNDDSLMLFNTLNNKNNLFYINPKPLTF